MPWLQEGGPPLRHLLLIDALYGNEDDFRRWLDGGADRRMTLVVKGTARFAFRHLVSGETFEILVRGDASRVVETVPGWVHNIMNVGGDEMVVLLWANEVFDPQKPDTIASAVKL